MKRAYFFHSWWPEGSGKELWEQCCLLQQYRQRVDKSTSPSLNPRTENAQGAAAKTKTNFGLVLATQSTQIIMGHKHICLLLDDKAEKAALLTGREKNVFIVLAVCLLSILEFLI